MDYELAFARQAKLETDLSYRTEAIRFARKLALRWIAVAAIYFVIGISLGIGMGMTHDFTLRGVHAHVNLLGWVSSALFGAIYLLLPGLASTRLSRVHFWLYNSAVPVATAALALMLLGYTQVGPVVGLSSLAIGIAVLSFVVNVLWYVVGARKGA
jgi:hypothetical protein